MARMKPVMPSLREKKRYVAFEVISSKQFSFQDVSRAISNAMLSFVGEFGTANAGVIPISNTFNAEIHKGLIKVNNKYVDVLKAALTLISNINEVPVITRTIGVSGMINKALKKYVAA